SHPRAFIPQGAQPHDLSVNPELISPKPRKDYGSFSGPNDPGSRAMSIPAPHVASEATPRGQARLL
ncbi:MAG: hypothetical protein ACJ758_04060, partial [Actinomycetota bacterium]